MEFNPNLIISILSITFCILTFARTSRDKASKDGNKQGIIEYKLEDLSKKVDKILDKLDRYDEEVEKKIAEAIKHHVAEMHGKD